MLTGACLGRAGLNRKTALATATMVIAAEIPDVDFLYSLGGSVFGGEHHRGWTHSFLGAPVMAALALGLVYAWKRIFPGKRPTRGEPVALQRSGPPLRWGLLYAFACCGVLVHILLDFSNNYGVRPFLPFSYKWHSWDIVFIIEPFMLLVLLGGLVVPSLFALVQEEIGARQAGPRGRNGAIFALVCILLMWGLRDYQHRRAVTAMDSLLYHGAEPVRVSAYPYLWNPFHWHGVVETRDFFETMSVDSLRGEVDPQNQARVYYKPEDTPVTLAAKGSPLGRMYLDWAAYPMTEVERLEPGGGYLVRLYDLRFVYPERKTRALAAAVELDKNLRVVAQRFGARAQRHAD